MRRREVKPSGSLKASNCMRDGRCRGLSRTEKNAKPFRGCDLGSDTRKLLAHEPGVAPDDKTLSSGVSFACQISANRFGRPPDVLESELVGDNRSPARRAEANRHTEPWNEKLLAKFSTKCPSQLVVVEFILLFGRTSDPISLEVFENLAHHFDRVKHYVFLLSSLL
jgi:hypothetical protein